MARALRETLRGTHREAALDAEYGEQLTLLDDVEAGAE